MEKYVFNKTVEKELTSGSKMNIEVSVSTDADKTEMRELIHEFAAWSHNCYLELAADFKNKNETTYIEELRQKIAELGRTYAVVLTDKVVDSLHIQSGEILQSHINDINEGIRMLNHVASSLMKLSAYKDK